MLTPKTGRISMTPTVTSQLLTWTKKKKRTILEICGEKNAVRSCDIMLDDARSTQSKVIRSCPRLLPCADRASSSIISHDGTAFFSPRISEMVLFFLSRVVDLCNCVYTKICFDDFRDHLPLAASICLTQASKMYASGVGFQDHPYLN